MARVYREISSHAGILELINQLPIQIRQAVLVVMEADPTSNYFYSLKIANYQIQLFLIEKNIYENYTVCHCFTTDTQDDDYAYESMCLTSIQHLINMANELELI